MLVTVVIRTYNEEKHLAELLEQIQRQNAPDFSIEVLVVDSGSTDSTVSIAEGFDAQIVYINKSDFTFGRSLNVGCDAARGDYLVFVSGHCVPCDQDWLSNLVAPLAADEFAYTYGRQLGIESSKFSEKQLFNKYYPAYGVGVSSKGIFCNNANAAIKKSVWAEYRFDESLTGLEDMALAKTIVNDGFAVGYIPSSSVYHIHEETWKGIRYRYEREAIALQQIMPEVQVGFGDFLRYYLSSLLLDFGTAIREKTFITNFGQILMFRLMQYWGTYRGNHEHRKLTERLKEEYFYPR